MQVPICGGKEGGMQGAFGRRTCLKLEFKSCHQEISPLLPTSALSHIIGYHWSIPVHRRAKLPQA